jgi:DNA-binding MarR family transcriptional regulator
LSRETKEQLVDEAIRLSRAHEAANDAFDELAAQKLGINRTDLRCMGIIENEGPLTAGRLARLSGLTTAAVTAVVDRLERAGYVRRVRGEQDRRQVILELTPLLAERAQPIWGPLGAEAKAKLGRLPAGQLEAAIAFFRFGIDLNERHAERVRKLPD